MATPAFLLLAIDAAGPTCSAALWARPAQDETSHLVGQIEREGPTGEAAFLPRMVADLLAETGFVTANLAAIAVNIGPGSFTGLRASIAFAQGMALGLGLPVVAVTMAEALREGLPTDHRHDHIWCALDARQGRMFLHQGGAPVDWTVAQLSDPPLPTAPVTLTGDAAAALGATLMERSLPVTISDSRRSHARTIALAAMRRLDAQLPPLSVVPLYIDPPRALQPRGGLRPPPQGWSAPRD